MSKIDQMNYYDVFKLILDNQTSIMTALSVLVSPSNFDKKMRLDLSRELMTLVLMTNEMTNDQG